MAKIGLVTVLFNSDDVLEGFFKSLALQSFKDSHLYLIDNTPSPTTDSLITELAGKYNIGSFTHVKNQTNVGVAKGNNQGIRLSIDEGSTHTLILNNDIEFEQPHLLADMYTAALSQNELLIVPKILFYDTRKIWMAGGQMNYTRGTCIHVGEGDNDGDLYNHPKHFNYAPTCFMLVDNTIFKDIGMMDEKYFVYYDDTDFIYRAVQAGHMVYYMPGFVVLHKVSSSTGGTESLFSIFYSNRNRIYFIKKNFTGLRYAKAMSFTLLTRIAKYAGYDKAQKASLRKAVVAGFHL